MEKISTFAKWYSQKFKEIAKDATQEQLVEIATKLKEMKKLYADAETAAPESMLLAQESEQKAMEEEIKRTTDLINIIKFLDCFGSSEALLKRMHL